MRKSFGQTLLQSNANQRRTLASLVRILGLQNKGTISKVCASFIRRRATANPMRMKSVEFNAIWVLGQRAIQPIADNAPPKSAQKCVVRCGFVASFPSPPHPIIHPFLGRKLIPEPNIKLFSFQFIFLSLVVDLFPSTCVIIYCFKNPQRVRRTYIFCNSRFFHETTPAVGHHN